MHYCECADMATAGVIPGNLPVFDGQGYDDCCVKIEAISGFQEVNDIVNIGFQEPPKKALEDQQQTYKANKKLDCKANMGYVATDVYGCLQT